VPKLNALQVENFKPEDRDYRAADGGGLYLLVRPNGSKLWRYDYRLGKTRRTLSIGEYDRLGDGVAYFSLAQARKAHETATATVGLGEHPMNQTQRAETAAKAEAQTTERLFGNLADIWLKAREANNSKKTYARDDRSVTYLKHGYRRGKGLGSLDVAEVKSSHLSALAEQFNKPTRVRVISAARKIMAVAKRTGFIAHSPFSDINFNEGFEKHKERKRPAITDEKQFGELLRRIEGYKGRGHNLTWYALKLLALTFVRPDTMAKSEWKHFDLEGARWVIPFEELKMEWLRSENSETQDDFVVPLSRQAVALLRDLHEITGHSRYLFPGSGDATVMSENTLNCALHALGYKGVHCAHGFRASASTILNRQRTQDGRRRFETALVEIQQDRLDASTRAIYDRDDLMPERIVLMRFWADKIDALRDAGLDAAKKKRRLRAAA
jgi:hypothetical protein